jgi:putative FmdB family regulatory protein
MPVYEFTCLDCGKQFDVVLSVREHDRHDVHCPACQSASVEQLITHLHLVTAKKS